MVKTPRTRHSKSERDPLTIELGPADVSRVEGTSGEISETHDRPDPQAEGISEPVADTSAEAVASSPSFEPTPEARSEEAADAMNTSGAGFSATAEEPKSEPSQPRPSAPPPSRPSRVSSLGAGLAGGVVALAAAGLLHYSGLLAMPGASTVSDIMPPSVETELAALKAEIEALKSGQAAPVDISGVTNQVDGLSQGLEQVTTDIASLRQSIEAGGAGDGAAVEALNAKIAEIESRIASIGPGAEGPSAQDIAAIGERIASVEALARAAGEADTTLTTRLGALEQSLTALSTKVDAQAGQPKIALAIASAALKSAIERGSPFQSEIETFAAIAPDAPGLVELRAYAEQGVATRADLMAETDAAAKAMIAAANPPPADAGFFERLLSSAESMVSVRPIGAVEGPGVPETVARMEVALQAGDLAKAMAEYDTLPDVAKSAGAAFAERIKARLAVEQLADQAIAAAMQAA
jgi:hypothetical protein